MPGSSAPHGKGVSLEIVPFHREFLPSAAALFVQSFKKLRRAVPILPDRMENIENISARLNDLFTTCIGAAAFEDGQFLGYMGWFIVNNFRDTARTGAYCPVWAHAATDSLKDAVYRALYRAAATQWVQAGCKVHAITLLADDVEAQKVWFWNGFGLAVVDAVRHVDPLGVTYPQGIHVRQAYTDDVQLIAKLEAEHWRHYTQPPIMMAPHQPDTAEMYLEFLGRPHNSVWLAFSGDEAAGYLRFEAQGSGATDIVASKTTIANTGAFIRSAFRGLRAAPALLDAALGQYKSLGFERCSVDFETFNPEAARFWMKYFQPVCFSVMRQPEA